MVVNYQALNGHLHAEHLTSESPRLKCVCFPFSVDTPLRTCQSLLASDQRTRRCACVVFPRSKRVAILSVAYLFLCATGFAHGLRKQRSSPAFRRCQTTLSESHYHAKIPYHRLPRKGEHPSGQTLALLENSSPSHASRCCAAPPAQDDRAQLRSHAEFLPEISEAQVSLVVRYACTIPGPPCESRPTAPSLPKF